MPVKIYLASFLDELRCTFYTACFKPIYNLNMPITTPCAAVYLTEISLYEYVILTWKCIAQKQLKQKIIEETNIFNSFKMAKYHENSKFRYKII